MPKYTGDIQFFSKLVKKVFSPNSHPSFPKSAFILKSHQPEIYRGSSDLLALERIEGLKKNSRAR